MTNFQKSINVGLLSICCNFLCLQNLKVKLCESAKYCVEKNFLIKIINKSEVQTTYTPKEPCSLIEKSPYNPGASHRHNW